MLCGRVYFMSFCTGVYTCLSKLRIEEDLCLAWFHVVAQAKSYHLVYIWGSLVKFQGGRVVLKTMLCARVRIC